MAIVLLEGVTLNGEPVAFDDDEMDTFLFCDHPKDREGICVACGEQLTDHYHPFFAV